MSKTLLSIRNDVKEKITFLSDDMWPVLLAIFSDNPDYNLNMINGYFIDQHNKIKIAIQQALQQEDQFSIDDIARRSVVPLVRKKDLYHINAQWIIAKYYYDLLKPVVPINIPCFESLNILETYTENITIKRDDIINIIQTSLGQERVRLVNELNSKNLYDILIDVCEFDYHVSECIEQKNRFYQNDFGNTYTDLFNGMNRIKPPNLTIDMSFREVITLMKNLNYSEGILNRYVENLAWQLNHYISDNILNQQFDIIVNYLYIYCFCFRHKDVFFLSQACRSMLTYVDALLTSSQESDYSKMLEDVKTFLSTAIASEISYRSNASSSGNYNTDINLAILNNDQSTKEASLNKIAFQSDLEIPPIQELVNHFDTLRDEQQTVLYSHDIDVLYLFKDKVMYQDIINNLFEQQKLLPEYLLGVRKDNKFTKLHNSLLNIKSTRDGNLINKLEAHRRYILELNKLGVLSDSHSNFYSSNIREITNPSTLVSRYVEYVNMMLNEEIQPQTFLFYYLPVKSVYNPEQDETTFYFEPTITIKDNYMYEFILSKYEYLVSDFIRSFSFENHYLEISLNILCMIPYLSDETKLLFIGCLQKQLTISPQHAKYFLHYLQDENNELSLDVEDLQEIDYLLNRLDKQTTQYKLEDFTQQLYIIDYSMRMYEQQDDEIKQDVYSSVIDYYCRVNINNLIEFRKKYDFPMYDWSELYSISPMTDANVDNCWMHQCYEILETYHQRQNDQNITVYLFFGQQPEMLIIDGSFDQIDLYTDWLSRNSAISYPSTNAMTHKRKYQKNDVVSMMLGEMPTHYRRLIENVGPPVSYIQRLQEDYQDEYVFNHMLNPQEVEQFVNQARFSNKTRNYLRYCEIIDNQTIGEYYDLDNTSEVDGRFRQNNIIARQQFYYHIAQVLGNNVINVQYAKDLYHYNDRLTKEHFEDFSVLIAKYNNILSPRGNIDILINTNIHSIIITKLLDGGDINLEIYSDYCYFDQLIELLDTYSKFGLSYQKSDVNNNKLIVNKKLYFAYLFCARLLNSPSYVSHVSEGHVPFKEYMKIHHSMVDQPDYMTNFEKYVVHQHTNFLEDYLNIVMDMLGLIRYVEQLYADNSDRNSKLRRLQKLTSYLDDYYQGLCKYVFVKIVKQQIDELVKFVNDIVSKYEKLIKSRATYFPKRHANFQLVFIQEMIDETNYDDVLLSNDLTELGPMDKIIKYINFDPFEYIEYIGHIHLFFEARVAVSLNVIKKILERPTRDLFVFPLFITIDSKQAVYNMAKKDVILLSYKINAPDVELVPELTTIQRLKYPAIALGIKHYDLLDMNTYPNSKLWNNFKMLLSLNYKNYYAYQFSILKSDYRKLIKGSSVDELFHRSHHVSSSDLQILVSMKSNCQVVLTYLLQNYKTIVEVNRLFREKTLFLLKSVPDIFDIQQDDVSIFNVIYAEIDTFNNNHAKYVDALNDIKNMAPKMIDEQILICVQLYLQGNDMFEKLLAILHGTYANIVREYYNLIVKTITDFGPGAEQDDPQAALVLSKYGRRPALDTFSFQDMITKMRYPSIDMLQAKGLYNRMSRSMEVKYGMINFINDTYSYNYHLRISKLQNNLSSFDITAAIQDLSSFRPQDDATLYIIRDLSIRREDSQKIENTDHRLINNFKLAYWRITRRITDEISNFINKVGRSIELLNNEITQLSRMNVNDDFRVIQNLRVEALRNLSSLIDKGLLNDNGRNYLPQFYFIDSDYFQIPYKSLYNNIYLSTKIKIELECCFLRLLTRNNKAKEMMKRLLDYPIYKTHFSGLLYSKNEVSGQYHYEKLLSLNTSPLFSLIFGFYERIDNIYGVRMDNFITLLITNCYSTLKLIDQSIDDVNPLNSKMLNNVSSSMYLIQSMFDLDINTYNYMRRYLYIMYSKRGNQLIMTEEQVNIYSPELQQFKNSYKYKSYDLNIQEFWDYEFDVGLGELIQRHRDYWTIYLNELKDIFAGHNNQERRRDDFNKNDYEPLLRLFANPPYHIKVILNYGMNRNNILGSINLTMQDKNVKYKNIDLVNLLTDYFVPATERYTNIESIRKISTLGLQEYNHILTSQWISYQTKRTVDRLTKQQSRMLDYGFSHRLPNVDLDDNLIIIDIQKL